MYTYIYLHSKFTCLWVIVTTYVTSLCNHSLRVTIRNKIQDPYRLSYAELPLYKQKSIYAENL